MLIYLDKQSQVPKSIANVRRKPRASAGDALISRERYWSSRSRESWLDATTEGVLTLIAGLINLRIVRSRNYPTYISIYRYIFETPPLVGHSLWRGLLGMSYKRSKLIRPGIETVAAEQGQSDPIHSILWLLSHRHLFILP